MSRGPSAGRSGLGRTNEPRRRAPGTLGGALRRAWVGYQRLLEEELAGLGYEQRGFPDGRVLRLCARRPEVTVSEIGQELGITRQGASKTVGILRDRGFVTLTPSLLDGREKKVDLTAHARRYLDAQRRAARTIERRLTSEVGKESFDALYALLAALGDERQPRLREYMRSRGIGPYLE